MDLYQRYLFPWPTCECSNYFIRSLKSFWPFFQTRLIWKLNLHFNSRDLRYDQLSGVLPAGMCNRTYSYGCFIFSGRFSSNCTACNNLASPGELQALKDFYNSTNGGSWINSANWLIGDPCISSWFGITCNSGFSIVGLDLSNNNVIGNLYSIGNLSYLTKLALSGNGLTGSIPLSISGMNSLANLTMSSNQLSGTIPTLPGAISYL